MRGVLVLLIAAPAFPYTLLQPSQVAAAHTDIPIRSWTNIPSKDGCGQAAFSIVSSLHWVVPVMAVSLDRCIEDVRSDAFA